MDFWREFIQLVTAVHPAPFNAKQSLNGFAQERVGGELVPPETSQYPAFAKQFVASLFSVSSTDARFNAVVNASAVVYAADGPIFKDTSGFWLHVSC